MPAARINATGKTDTLAMRKARALRALMTFRQIVSAAKGHFLKVRLQCDLSGAQLWALSQVRDSPGMTVLELAAAMCIHQSTTSNLIEKLASGGCLRKVRETADRRVVRLYPTAAGLRILRKAPGPAQGVLPEAIGRLSDEDLKILEKALASLAREVSGFDSKAAKQPLSDLLS